MLALTSNGVVNISLKIKFWEKINVTFTANLTRWGTIWGRWIPLRYPFQYPLLYFTFYPCNRSTAQFHCFGENTFIGILANGWTGKTGLSITYLTLLVYVLSWWTPSSCLITYVLIVIYNFSKYFQIYITPVHKPINAFKEPDMSTKAMSSQSVKPPLLNQPINQWQQTAESDPCLCWQYHCRALCEKGRLHQSSSH